MSELVCMAKIRTAHGVRGLVKLDCYNEDPESLPDFNPLVDEKGREYNIVRLSRHKDYYLAEIEGITSCEQVEKLRNTELFISRDLLPEIDEEGTYYQIDLIGLAVIQDGETIGKVKSLQNFGAGELLEIENPEKEITFLPFKDEFVPQIDIKGGTITVIKPDEIIVEEK